MRWVLAIMVLFVVVCHPLPVSAACDKAHPVSPGDVVLCEGAFVPGVLLDSMRLSFEKAQADLELCQSLRKVDTEEFMLRVSVEADRLALCEQEKDSFKEAALQFAETDLVARPWYEHPAFVATMSVVVTVAIGASVVALAGHLADQ